MATADKGFGYFVRTENQPHRYRLVWTIENFLHYPAEDGAPLDSPIFKLTSGVDHGVEWSVKIYPYFNDDGKDYVSAFLRYPTLPQHIDNLNVVYDISILNLNREKLNTMSETVTSLQDWERRDGYHWATFIKRGDLESEENEINEYLPDGHLTLECNVEAYFSFKEPVHSTRIHSEVGVIQTDLGNEVLKSIYQDKICPDVKLKASDGRVFDAHKNLLSVRSPYFKVMFQNPKKENEEGVVDLSKGMNGNELKSLLQDIYLRTPPTNLETARKMFEIADMQGIPWLRELSEEALIGQVDDDNAAAMEIANSDE